MAHESPGSAARPQVHADAVGLQRCRWAILIHGHQAGAKLLGLGQARRDLQISPAEFDDVAAELERTLDVRKVPKREKAEVPVAFAAVRTTSRLVTSDTESGSRPADTG